MLIWRGSSLVMIKMKLVAILLFVGLAGATSVPRITYDELKRIPEEASLLEQIKEGVFSAYLRIGN